jgi:NADH:ubiquinone oxidoreductase subunit 4 (subunit M)
MLTALAGAMLAVQQDDVKRMLAYSSMSQLGYIVTAIALMSHLGWVTALYLTANHLMTKGILFLVAAAIFCEQARAHSPTSAVSRVPCPLPLQPRRSPSWPCPVSLRSPGSAANGCC